MEKKSRDILIVANGQPPAQKVWQQLLQKSQRIIAADGGSTICYQHGIQPDFIIGDLDSFQSELHDFFKSTRIIHEPDQNSHDLEKAIEFARTLNPEKIRIAGAFGKRADQTLANLLTLQTKLLPGQLEFYDDLGCLEIITAEHELNLPVGQIVSLFSFQQVRGISLQGFKYTLQDADYEQGFNGLSNVITHRPARISIKQGSLFLYILLDHD
jgi:thiamine pyrophosphokinase